MKLLVTFLVIPLIIVLAIKSPEAVGRLAEVVIIGGAKVLDWTATFLNALLNGGH